MEERGHLMDLQRDLEETFEPVMASNKKKAENIIKDLHHEGLHELNRNLEV